MISESRQNAELSNVANLVQFREEDLFKTDISPATVVMLYLSPNANLALRPRLLRLLKPGARIVSHTHDMGDWEPEKRSVIEDHDIYLWTVPAEVSGTWTLQMTGAAGPTSSITFKQSYQKVEATIKSGQDIISSEEARLDGCMLQFTIQRPLRGYAGPMSFAGEVKGDLIKGKFKSSSKSGQWTSKRKE